MEHHRIDALRDIAAALEHAHAARRTTPTPPPKPANTPAASTADAAN